MTKELNKTVDASKITRQFQFEPNSFNQEKRTVDVIFSSGAQVKRMPFMDEPFFEELSLSPDSVRLERFQNGAPVLDSHSQFRIKDVLGVVENPTVNGQEGRATLRFSSREDLRELMQDVRDRIVRNVSVGYRIHKMEKVGEREGMNILRATDWEPVEVSLVAVGADPNAGTRSKEEEPSNPCEIILHNEEGETMKRSEDEKAAEAEAAKKAEEAKSSEGEAQSEGSEESKSEDKAEEPKPEEKSEESKNESERRGEKTMTRSQNNEPSNEQVRKETLAYVSEVRGLCKTHGMKEEFETRMIEDNKTVDQVRAAILDEMKSRTESTEVRGQNATVTAGSYDQRDVAKEGMTNAILNRYKSSKHELSEKGKMFRGLTLMEMAKESLEAVNIRTRGMSRNQVLDAAFATRTAGYHSTSDFPLLLEDIVNKTLRAGYREAPQTFMPFTRMVTVSDFKTISRTQIGDAPELLEIPETGEYKDGSVGEGAEKYAVKDYGRIVSITRKVIINDDLDAFTRVPEMYGRRARSLESNLAWAQITSNPLLADGVNLFDAAGHNNLTTGPGTVISIDSIGIMRGRMRRQLSLGGDFINVDPRYLVVPTSLETIGQQFISQIQADAAGNVNPFAGTLQLVAEPRLDDASATAWYAFSTSDEIDILEMAKLSGEEEPMIATRDGWRVDGAEIKVRHTVGAKVIDYRGLQKNDGA